MLNENIKAFVVQISSLSLRFKIIIYSTWKNQITLLISKKITIPIKYFDFANIFSK